MTSKRMMAGASLLTLGLTLAACGGGVDSTPTPTPTPTDTGTPTPTPTEPYLTIQEMFAKPSNKVFRTAGVSWTKTGTADPTGFDSYAFSSKLLIGYDETKDNYKVTPTGETAVEFPIGSNTPGGNASFSKTTSNITDTLKIAVPQVNSVPLSYTLLFDFTRTDSTTGKTTFYQSVGGFLSQTGDMPRTGSANYTMMVDGSATRDGDSKTYLLGGHSTGTFSASFADGKINTTLSLKGEASGGATSDFGTATGTGNFAVGGPTFTGTFTGANNATGKFSGGFFGPAAAEAGYGWYFQGSDFDAHGVAAGTKNVPAPTP
ncbi:hypothetical protein H0274_02800 [Altererythrobacter sp. CC-YST694]|uniref:transferrin-binding protein-like solute binding protein n=1 Tax=Altererythrobacter sp. CC-YST694 TaxID=2755038 RepID=UPI001D003D56|nr:transferrin-binding protein-like solute binding protein [Altererythrobacter sp. CC-YST694]MCB5424177.1 hypothetical protein [Altererythrobacter sp. CC-YST694]